MELVLVRALVSEPVSGSEVLLSARERVRAVLLVRGWVPEPLWAQGRLQGLPVVWMLLDLELQYR